MLEQHTKAVQFYTLHQTELAFVMPNAWDCGSAKMLAAAGFPAIATTSAGIAFSLGRPDSENAVNKVEMLDRVQQIAQAVNLPVSADLEAGFGIAPAMVAQTIQKAIQAGVVGCNIEDVTDDKTRPLFDVRLASARIQAACLAANALNLPFILTARTDTVLWETSKTLLLPTQT